MGNITDLPARIRPAVETSAGVRNSKDKEFVKQVCDRKKAALDMDQEVDAFKLSHAEALFVCEACRAKNLYDLLTKKP